MRGNARFDLQTRDKLQSSKVLSKANTTHPPQSLERSRGKGRMQRNRRFHDRGTRTQMKDSDKRQLKYKVNSVHKEGRRWSANQES